MRASAFVFDRRLVVRQAQNDKSPFPRRRESSIAKLRISVFVGMTIHLVDLSLTDG
jgi:hypothetical protein